MTATGLRRFPARDAARGRLLLLSETPDAEAELYAEHGYDVLAADLPADPSTLIEAWAPPVFALGLGEAAAAVWRAAQAGAPFTAVACQGPVPEADLLGPAPLRPALVQLGVDDPRLDAAARERVREARPELRLHAYPRGADLGAPGTEAARLARLRTLQLFHRAAGGREAGG